MQKLDILSLHDLRLKIFDNAEELHKEAKLLFEHEMYARAYLLAYYCFEELGKIPIIVGVIVKLNAGEQVDWKKVQKRFCKHTAKISSQNHHYYMFGLDPDLLRDSDLAWLKSAQDTVGRSFNMKNMATYVDVQDGSLLVPSNQISKSNAEEIIEFAFGCLKAHWHSESRTNPILIQHLERSKGGNNAQAKQDY